MSNEDKITPDKYGAVNPDKTPVSVCYVCGFPYERSKMVMYKSNYYCRPNECYKDIEGLRRKNRRG